MRLAVRFHEENDVESGSDVNMKRYHSILNKSRESVSETSSNCIRFRDSQSLSSSNNGQDDIEDRGSNSCYEKQEDLQM